MSTNYSAVLFSGGLDSAVLLADAAAAGQPVVALYVRVGFAWEAEERAMAARLFESPPFAGRVELVDLSFDMGDTFPPAHWAMRGTPPAFDTPDEDVFLDGRNIILLSKAAVYMARRCAGVTDATVTLMLGPLEGNPFPDATPQFFAAMAAALSRGLALPIAIRTPFVAMRKAERRIGTPPE